MDDYKNLSIELNNKFPIYQEYFDELIDFYKTYFVSIEELECFLETVLSFEYDKITNRNIPRLMINNTMRLANLANDMEKIRPGRDALKITYLITCVETLYKLSSKTIDKNGRRLNKVSTVVDFFETCTSEEDKKYILNKVRRSLADASFKPGEPFSQTITIGIFARIINETRNIFMHEGDYWSHSLSSMNSPILRIMNVEEAQGTGKQERVYEFELEYKDLYQLWIRALIYFIDQYMNCELMSL